MTTVIICAGGPTDEVIDLDRYKECEALFIGADRGALYLLNKGIIPKYAVGDFDSVTREEYEYIASYVKEITKYLSEKDETDLELAIDKAMLHDPEKVILTGVTGGRLDHTESALHLIYRLQQQYPKTKFSMRNKLNEMAILLPQTTYTIRKDYHYPYISFFAFQGVINNLTLTGVKYPVHEATLEVGVTRFTSNEIQLQQGTAFFQEGICLMIRSSDR